jgi:hypothetical protein
MYLPFEETLLSRYPKIHDKAYFPKILRYFVTLVLCYLTPNGFY